MFTHVNGGNRFDFTQTANRAAGAVVPRVKFSSAYKTDRQTDRQTDLLLIERKFGAFKTAAKNSFGIKYRHATTLQRQKTA